MSRYAFIAFLFLMIGSPVYAQGDVANDQMIVDLLTDGSQVSPTGEIEKTSEEETLPFPQVMEGAKQTSNSSKSNATYRVFAGVDDRNKPTGPELTGDLQRFAYRHGRKQQPQEVFAHYRGQILDGGAEIMFECDQWQGKCISEFAGRKLPKYNSINTIVNNGGLYLLAREKGAEQTRYIALATGFTNTQIDVITFTGEDPGLLAADAGPLIQAMNQDGHFILNGIYFEPGTAKLLREESRAGLDATSTLLLARPAMNSYIVGHTAQSGNLAADISLSRSRAVAVVDEFYRIYKFLDSGRLLPDGVGSLSPLTTNNTPNGREQNERIEIVLIGELDP